MQADLHSFSKAILCRRVCDRCRKVIRFLGYRCRECRYKCHRKCSSCILQQCQSLEFQANKTTCKVGRFWHKHPKDKRKWQINKQYDAFASIPADSRRLERSLRPRKYTDAKGKIRQKLINGLYDSFCYNSRHGIDLHPVNETQTLSPNVARVTVHGKRDLLAPLQHQSDVMSQDSRFCAQPVLTEQYLPCPHSWRRTYSWSSRHSAMTSFTSSSGYSSAAASCPSSANSHRSTSPTPDFANIRSLTATLERCSLEEGINMGESHEGLYWEKSVSFVGRPGTWPLHRKSRSSHSDTKRILSVDDCQSTDRDESMANTGSYAESSEDDIKKSLREWRIPFSDLQFGEAVGASPKGLVYKGRWHGDIMIHTVKKTAKEDFEEFLKEVSLLSMIRHENVVLFMGACLEPPNLAFITSIRKGLSLHSHLHVRHDFFPLSTRISIARQIAQGMSYLHAKGIVLPHFNSMNVFLESKVKLCLTAYSGRTTVERYGYVSLPRGHLTYVPPEMMRTLRWSDDEIVSSEVHSIPTNVYAYGTILYEIMTGRWPYSFHPVESIIWMVGKGTKQCIRHTKCPENIKSILSQCWDADSKERPDFSTIVKFFLEENFPAQDTHKRINGSFSEPEKMHMVGRSSGRLSIR